MRINNTYCKAYSRRMFRHNAVLKPARHLVAWINIKFPMMELIFEEVHQKMHCRLGPQSYVNGINLAGFCANGLKAYVQEQIDGCNSCTETKKGASELTELDTPLQKIKDPNTQSESLDKPKSPKKCKRTNSSKTTSKAFLQPFCS